MPRNCRRILVVDDEKAMGMVLSTILSVLGFEVEVATNGQEGLLLFLERPFDLVMTDLQMPGIDGWTLARHIKDKSSRTPIVLITGDDKVDVTERLKKSCIDHAIFKPFLVEDIQATVQRALASAKDREAGCCFQ